MHKKTIWLIAACVALGGGSSLQAGPPETPSSNKALASLQQAVAEVTKKASPSLALVKVEKGSSDDGAARAPAGFMVMGGGSGGPSSASGIIISPQGHILVQGVFKADQDQRLIATIGENEFVARSIKVDETLGMSILKVQADEPLRPLDITKGADLAQGEWAVGLTPGDEDADYQTLANPVVCQGGKDGYYRQFKLGLTSGASGAIVFNLSGQLVGFLERSAVTSIKDLNKDLQRLVADATGKKSDDEEKKKQGWLGTMLTPVNKDYAKAEKIPTSGLCVNYVCKDSPAAAAGLQAGDIIVALNGKPLKLTGFRALEYFTKSLQPRTGEKFTITALRDKKSADYSGTYTESPETETMRAEDIGVTVSAITDGDAFSKNLATERGVLITDVTKGSPASNSGSLGQTLLMKNDIITELAGQATPDLDTFSKVLESIRREKPPVVLVKFQRGLSTGYAGLNLTLGEKFNGNKQ